MVSTAAEAREAFIADAESDQGWFVQVEREPGLGTRGIFVHQTTIDVDDLQRAFLEFVGLLVFNARICQATSRSATTSAVIDFAPRRRMASRRCRPFGVQKPPFGATTAIIGSRKRPVLLMTSASRL
jgi:hypothetical protein